MGTLILARAGSMLHRGAMRTLPLCATVGLGVYMTASDFGKGMQLQPVAPYSSKPKLSFTLKERLDPDTIRQMAGGSVAGFITGLFVSAVSNTLVLLAGLFMISAQIAARYGIDLIRHLRLKQRLKSSRIIALLRNHPTFKLSFALTFALAAFAHF